MENLNAEQVISELRKNDSCYAEDIKAIQNAIALINSQEQRIAELEIELKAMRGAANAYKMHMVELTEENERLIQAGFDTADYAVDKIRDARAATVWKMQEMVKRRASTVGNSYANGEAVIIQYCISPQSLDQIAKEMLEGENV